MFKLLKKKKNTNPAVIQQTTPHVSTSLEGRNFLQVLKSYKLSALFLEGQQKQVGIDLLEPRNIQYIGEAGPVYVHKLKGENKWEHAHGLDSKNRKCEWL